MRIVQTLRSYAWQFLFTLFLVLLDAILLVLFPLFIGYAINDALDNEFQGAVYLGILGFVSLLVGSSRRFLDSRFYARVYRTLGAEIGDNRNNETTTKSAHLGFLTEVVEFFENALPELINNSLGLIGTLIVIATLDFKLFIGCLVIIVILLLVYGLSSQKTRILNSGYNKEQEQQVAIVSAHQPILLRNHLKKLMRWNIRLSDLETINFAIIWFFMMVFLVFGIVMAVQQEQADHGTVFSLVLYLFQFVESTAIMPVFYQQWLRLKEIIERVELF